MITREMMPPLMFGGLILAMLIGFPVAFTLAAVGLSFGFLAIHLGFFDLNFLQAIPGRVFALPREAGVTRRDKTYLWGHSAGGQFVHRLLATQPHGIFEAVGAANSGWYTLPTLDLDYPDGLGGIGLTREDVVRLLGYPLVIFSGDQDIDGTAENFPRHEAAMAQGPNRFARAQFYIARG